MEGEDQADDVVGGVEAIEIDARAIGRGRLEIDRVEVILAIDVADGEL